MDIDHDTLYSALSARDSRFDGVFFVGVTSTGIYCRPICPARTPSSRNCRFFASAEAAGKARFRPCLRCRPELAPGNAPVDNQGRVVALLVQRLDEGSLGQSPTLEEVSRRFGWSSRQIRRMVQQELGVSPHELIQSRRLLLAKQLLTETDLPISAVASASGFRSLRRFNDAFRSRHGMAPTRFRKATPIGSRADGDTITLQMGYRPPYDWNSLLDFLAGREVSGVEAIDTGAYLRTARLGPHRGWIKVSNDSRRNRLSVTLSTTLMPALPALLGRLRHLFDLGARPDLINARLGADPLLVAAVTEHPGLRVPGTFDGFEMAIRAILGQQITVRAATTLSGRFVARFGEALDTPFPALMRLSPTPERVAQATIDDIASLGIIANRARCIIAVAQALDSGVLRLEPGADPEETMAALESIPGIGKWTANYIAMRALRWPDAFPKEDIVLRKALGGVTARQAEARSEAWRPWRSYAALQLWRQAG